ncbi:hypothetical protein Tco_0695990 [Tanacetum coccineum]
MTEHECSNGLDGAIVKQNEKLIDYGAAGGKQMNEVLSITFNKPIVNSSRPISYAKLLNGESSGKTVNFRTLLAPASNGVAVAISMESVRVVHKKFSNTVYGFFLGKRMAYVVVENYLCARILEVGEGYTMSTIHVEYKWTPPRCSSYKFFVHIRDECPKKIISDVLKNLMKPRQAIRGVQVGSKCGSKVQFKLTEQVYQRVSKKNGASSSGTKKQARLTTQKEINSNPFDALNTVDFFYNVQF